ncbi:hypothetical protein Tco_1559378, partial [Tanacetum coccineum]
LFSACCRMSSSKLVICFTTIALLALCFAFAAADEEFSLLAIEGLHQHNFYIVNIHLIFSSNPSFRDFTARILKEY